MADQTVYPNSFRMHNRCINMVANLWHAPLDQEEFKKYGPHIYFQ